MIIRHHESVKKWVETPKFVRETLKLVLMQTVTIRIHIISRVGLIGVSHDLNISSLIPGRTQSGRPTS